MGMFGCWWRAPNDWPGEGDGFLTISFWELNAFDLHRLQMRCFHECALPEVDELSSSDNRIAKTKQSVSVEQFLGVFLLIVNVVGYFQFCLLRLLVAIDLLAITQVRR